MRMRRDPDLINPRRYSEKVLWRKLYDRRDILTRMSDKLQGWEYADIPSPKILLVSDDPDVDLDIPRPFVVKPNNWSGQKWFFTHDSSPDMKQVRGGLRRCATTNYGMKNGEWGYENIPFRVLAEELLEGFVEIKVFCFGGKARLVRYVIGSGRGRRISYYNRGGNLLKMKNRKQEHAGPAPKWVDIPQVAKVAERISHGLDHVRVDLFVFPDRILFGEYTFYSGSGHTWFVPESMDEWLGSWWELPEASSSDYGS